MLRLLMKELLLSDQFYKVDEQYKLGEEKASSLLKFLLRCQKMLDAKNEVVRII